jgi:SAM-dependent methyltransferase
MRYAPILRALRDLEPGARVLEVGCGSEGLGTWWSGRYFGVDLRFEFTLHGDLIAARADATKLPFPDATFDLVVCPGVMTVLEGSLPIACHEIARVTRGSAVVVSPSGAHAEELDRENARWCRAHGVRMPSWFEDQVERGLPDPKLIRTSLASSGGVVSEGTTISVAWMRRVFRVEQRMRQLHAMTAIQPILRGKIGAALARELSGGATAYERWFRLEVGQGS